MAKVELLKLHRQLGRASSFNMLRLNRLAGRKCNEQELLAAITQCGGHTMDKRAGEPLANKNLPKQAGGIAFADIMCPIR